jgi:hypothetical protein
MRVRLWGVRGSTPVPGPAVAGFGGNTPCVQVTAADGTEMILDAGTGIRELGKDIVGRCRRVHILLTRLHLDHIQGLMFFAPMFDSEAEVTVWGPPAGGRALRDRLARYISNPLSAIEIRDLAAKVTFVDTPTEQWRIGDVEVRASLVAHRGPTLGYRLSEDGASVAYLPDTSPASARGSTPPRRDGSRATGSRGTRRCSFTMPSTPTRSTRHTAGGATRACLMLWRSRVDPGRAGWCSSIMPPGTTTIVSSRLARRRPRGGRSSGARRRSRSPARGARSTSPARTIPGRP